MRYMISYRSQRAQAGGLSATGINQSFLKLIPVWTSVSPAYTLLYSKSSVP